MRQVKIGVEIARLALERALAVGAVFKLLPLLQERLRLFLVLPEIGSVDFYFEFSYLLAGGFGVKDSSARARCVSAARRSVVRGLRYAQPCSNPTQESEK